MHSHQSRELRFKTQSEKFHCFSVRYSQKSFSMNVNKLEICKFSKRLRFQPMEANARLNTKSFKERRFYKLMSSLK